MPYRSSRSSKSIHRWALRLAPFTVAAGLTGCTVTASTDAGSGGLTVDWTIASTQDPSLCTTYGASSIVVHLFDATGAQVGSGYTQSCAALAMSIQSLPAAAYSFDAVLVDGTGSPVTTTLPRTTVTVAAGITSTVAVDFPATSFLSGQPGTTTGTLAVTWDIDGSMDPSLCAAHNVDSIRFRLSDSGGTVVGDETVQPCTAFTATASYPVGVYTFGAELYLGTTVRTTSAMATVNIVAGTSTTQPVTFASSAFYMQ